jgi:competence protein ComEC
MFGRIKYKIPYIILAALAAGAVFVWLAVFGTQTFFGVKFYFFDVGQGSSLLVAAENGNQVLIDGGPSFGVLTKLGETLPTFDRKIELLILTHPDADHLDGLIEVLKRYDVGAILETGIITSSADYQAWNDLIKSKKIPVVFARAGQTVKIADNLSVQILHPLAQISGQDFSKNTNNTSIVGKIIYGQNEILFTGDAEAATESVLLASGENLNADILLVGHHGSKNSTSEEFLKAVSPVWAVIQVGARNSYGHPTKEVLDRLAGIKLWRTDLDKDIEFICDLNACQAAVQKI